MTTTTDRSARRALRWTTAAVVALAVATCGAPLGAQTAGGTATSAARAASAPPFTAQVVRSLASRRATARLVGASRARQLDELRYRLAVVDWSPLRELGDDPREQEWMEGCVLGSLKKIARELVLEHGPIGRLQDRVRHRVERWEAARARPGLDLSPRLDLGSDRYLGAAIDLELPGSGRLPRGSELRFEARHGLDTGRHLLRLRWQVPGAAVTLDHRFDEEGGGDELFVAFRMDLGQAG